MVSESIGYGMVKIEDLYDVYFLARANKRRSLDAIMFELDYEKNLKELCKAINERTYRANANYTFVATKPRPREIFGCEIESRIIQWYIVRAIAPILEKELTPRTFNNRIGMGVDAAINCVHDDIIRVSRNFSRDAYIIQWDLKGYFPNANCDIIQEQLQNLVKKYYNGEDKDDILWMIMISVQANPQNHCYRKSPLDMWQLVDDCKSLFKNPEGKGGAIGFLIFQTAMNLYLNEIDKYAFYELGLAYTRFVDDTIIVVENKDAALTLLPIFRKKYEEVGAIMHPKKFYCQHVSKGVKFLGTWIKFNRKYLANRTIRNAEQRIILFNKCHNKRRYIEDFQASINSYLGILKNRSEFNTIKRLTAMINPDWLKYLEMDWDRCCMITKDGYKHKDNLKYLIYDKRRAY